MKLARLNGQVFRHVTGGCMTLVFLGIVLLAYLTVLCGSGCGSVRPWVGGPLGSASEPPSFPAPPSVRPDGCVDSVLWDETGNTVLAGAHLVVAIYKEEQHRSEYQARILEAVDYAEELATKKGITYQAFAAAVIKRTRWINKYLGAEVFVPGDLAQVFKDRPFRISNCDRSIICRHLAHQRRYLAQLRETETP